MVTQPEATEATSAVTQQANGGGATTTTQQATTTTATPAPVIKLDSMRCSGGQLIANVTVRVTGSGNKYGVATVSVSRPNEYNAAISANATWLGPDTGAGDVWTGSLPGNSQGIGKTLTVNARGDNGQTSSVQFPITANC